MEYVLDPVCPTNVKKSSERSFQYCTIGGGEAPPLDVGVCHYNDPNDEAIGGEVSCIGFNPVRKEGPAVTCYGLLLSNIL